mmetsp:Transcript_30783/g.64269  ORF Transcript_30783/g.64269 Transcript_30783/m.64269 type:complete len:251 (+) Transcript_30783:774-1526(+)
MHGKGGHIGIVLKQDSIAIALVNIQIQKQDALHKVGIALKYDIGRHRHIRKDRKTFPAIVKGMMCARCDMGGPVQFQVIILVRTCANPLNVTGLRLRQMLFLFQIQNMTSGSDGPSYGTETALDALFTPWKPHIALFELGHVTLNISLNIGWTMRRFQFGHRGQGRDGQLTMKLVVVGGWLIVLLVLFHPRLQQFSRLSIFGHGESMVGRQVYFVDVIVENLKRSLGISGGGRWFCVLQWCFRRRGLYWC